MATKPVCDKKETVARSRLFNIERLHLSFTNGEKRVYERLASEGLSGVMMVPLLDNETFLLVKEYACGTDSYELGFPKGLMNAGESPMDAANRELKEEIHKGAKTLTPLCQLSSSPNYFGLKLDVLIAQDLYDEALPGDEPEPITVIPWRFKDIDELLTRDDFTEARSIAALFLVKRFLENRQ